MEAVGGISCQCDESSKPLKNPLPNALIMAKATSKDLIREKLEKGHIHFSTIIEILGAPKEHVVSTLKAYVDKIRHDEQYTLLKEEFSEPKEMDKLFTQFVDLELLAKDASAIAFFCFDYMPSSIEIIEPQSFTYRAADFSAFFNDMQARLHKIDRFVKELAAQHKNLLRNSNRLLRNNVLIVLTYKGAMGLDELSRRIGVPPDQLKPFTEEMVKEKHIMKDGERYSLLKKQEGKPKKTLKTLIPKAKAMKKA